MDERVSLRSHLDQSASQTPHGAAVGEVIEALASAAIELAGLIADGPLAGITGQSYLHPAALAHGPAVGLVHVHLVPEAERPAAPDRRRLHLLAEDEIAQVGER